MKKNMRKALSLLLSVLMVTSVFGGMGFTVSATGTAKAIELVTNGTACGLPPVSISSGVTITVTLQQGAAAK